jgi:hypothetical protein
MLVTSDPRPRPIAVAAKRASGANERHVVDLLQRSHAPQRRARLPRTSSGDEFCAAAIALIRW